MFTVEIEPLKKKRKRFNFLQNIQNPFSNTLSFDVDSMSFECDGRRQRKVDNTVNFRNRGIKQTCKII